MTSILSSRGSVPAVRAVTPSVSMTRQNGQPVATFLTSCGGLQHAECPVDTVDVDALADLLLHPHAGTAGAAAWTVRRVAASR